jgi:bacterial/archaeal transporter family protein
MKNTPLNSTGLFFATAASINNVGFDVAAKRALSGRNFLQTTLRIRALVAVLLSFVILGLWFHRSTRSSLVLFRYGFFGLLHAGIVPVLLLSTGMVTVSIFLYYRSLQIAPISLVAPLFGFTPVFLLISGFVIFRHLPSLQVIAGVLCILLGSVQAHWRPSMRSPGAALSGFLREKGVGTMLCACLLLSVTNLLDKWLVMRLDVLTYAWLYVVLCAVFTAGLVFALRPGKSAYVPAKRWIVVASVLDTTVLLLHFASLQYIDAVVTIAIKRSGMLLSVLAGSFFFQEKALGQRLAAALVVLIGVFMMYLQLRPWQLGTAFAVAAGASALALGSARALPELPAETALEP